MKKFTAYLEDSTWLDVMLLVLIIAFSDGAQAAPAASFSAAVSGVTTNQSITVTANIADEDLGKTGNYYVGFLLNNVWYFNNGTTWLTYKGGTVPTYAVRTLVSGTVQVVKNLNLTNMVGGRLYIGYSLNGIDILVNAHYAMVYTVTANSVVSGPAAVLLGTAGNYAILAKTAVSSVPASIITGNVGLSPAATSFITGFSLTMVGTLSATSPQVTGSLYGADMTPPTNTNLTTAVSNMEAAYTDAAGRPTPDFLNLGGGNIGGLTLVPGLYKWGSSVTIPADVTIAGGPNDVWIFQMSGNLDISASKHVTLSGGALANHIFWQAAGDVTLQSGAVFQGNILSQSAIILQTGATLNGRALAQTRVSLDHATVTKPAP